MPAEPKPERPSDGGMTQGDEGPTPREVCYRCFKAARVCVCASIQSVDTRTPVYVVQHPRERRHPIGSLRFAELGLRSVRRREAAPDDEGRLIAALPDLSNAALLYPGPEAGDLEADPRKLSTLIVLDGTWSTVRALMRDDPRLAALPRVTVRTPTPHRYRIRREPNDRAMSTLEAVVRALQALEPARRDELETLMLAFDAMVAQQIEIAEREGRPRRRRPRNRGATIPTAFVSAPSLVALAVETTQINRIDAGGQRSRRELVRLSALRVDDGARFDALVRPSARLPSAAQLAHMGVDAGALAMGLGPRQLTDAWRAFLRPEDRLVAWNQLELDVLPPTEHERREVFVLKGIYAAARGCRGGAIEDAHARELDAGNLPAATADDPLPGRSGRRVAAAADLARLLRAASLPK